MASANSTASIFGTDQVLSYNISPWKELGFGVPNFGDVVLTQNRVLWRLADEIGKVQLLIMSHVDTNRRAFPSINTIRRIGKIVNRVKTILLTRSKSATDIRTEGGHGVPSAIPWIMHPVPYFTGPLAKNPWLTEYNEYCMIALTNIMQHTDNQLPLTLTRDCSALIWSYFAEIQRLLGGELLNLPRDTFESDDFRFEEQHYAGYDPESSVISVEFIDSPGRMDELPTEADLRPFLSGIPSNIIIPSLAKYTTTQFNNFPGSGGASQVSHPASGTADGSALQAII